MNILDGLTYKDAAPLALSDGAGDSTQRRKGAKTPGIFSEPLRLCVLALKSFALERGPVLCPPNARVNAAAALASSGSLPENVNYAVKSSYLLSFLEVFADGQLKLKAANTKEIKFEEVVEQAKQAAVLVRFTDF